MQHRKATRPKRSGVPKAARSSNSSKQTDLAQLTRERDEALIENARLLNELRESLQQQTATADVLKVISRSTFDLQTVLDTLTESAAGLCGAEMATIARSDGNAYYWATAYGYTTDIAKLLKSVPLVPGRGSLIGLVLVEGKNVNVPDVTTDPEYALRELQAKVGFRSVLGVPLLREGHPIGVIALVRTSVHPFSEREIELATTFADQAVIAIENVRLFDEVQKRTEELSESLEQQTATADVLKIISRSAFNLKAVLQTLVESAARLCDADKVNHRSASRRRVNPLRDLWVLTRVYGIRPARSGRARSGQRCRPGTAGR